CFRCRCATLPLFRSRLHCPWSQSTRLRVYEVRRAANPRGHALRVALLPSTVITLPDRAAIKPIRTATFYSHAPRPRAARAREIVEQNRASSFPWHSCRLTLPHGRLSWPPADTLWMPCTACYMAEHDCS